MHAITLLESYLYNAFAERDSKLPRVVDASVFHLLSRCIGYFTIYVWCLINTQMRAIKEENYSPKNVCLLLFKYD